VKKRGPNIPDEARAKRAADADAGIGRKPEYRLKALNKATGEKSRNAGAAWVNEDGSISIDVEPFVVLRGGKDLVLTLFPEHKK
jgi:hypothetical protein